MQTLNDILSTLNDRAHDYEFGRLQDIRKRRRPLKRRPSAQPFGSTERRWAHHLGGRAELQFNVGEDEGLFRWGIAISLQPSQTLPDVTVLHSRLTRLSSVLEVHGGHLHRLGFSMWDWTDGDGRGRSRDRPPQAVADTLYEEGSFVFVGKRAPCESFDPARVLSDFDVLLPIYEHVEFEAGSPAPVLYSPRGFHFRPDADVAPRGAPDVTTVHRAAGTSSVSLAHRALQRALKRELLKEGAEVGTEQRDGKGGYIDLVANRAGAIEFYEIKTDTSPRLAIRNAIGQLLEYANWPEPVRPSRLVVAGPSPLDSPTAHYLQTITAETHLPVGYRQVTQTKQGR